MTARAWLIFATGRCRSPALGIELPHGPVVDTLIDRGFVLHAINPKQLDRLRDMFSVAGAKNDRRDAYVLGVGVGTDGRLFRRPRVTDPRMVELRHGRALPRNWYQRRRHHVTPVAHRARWMPSPHGPAS